MPSIFDEHNLKEAAKRVLAASSDSEIKIDDARALRKKLDGVIAAHDARNTGEARRAAKLQAAIADESKHGAVEYAKGALRRIGLDFVAAADINKLNAALSAANLDTTKRIEIKRLLAELGVID